MAFAKALLQRLGFFTPKADTTDVFENRLSRIGNREARRDVRRTAFVKTPA